MSAQPTYEELAQKVNELEAEIEYLKHSGSNDLSWIRLLLQQSELETDIILDSLQEHVIYLNKDLKIGWANREACNSAGLTRSQLQGRHCYEIWPQRNDQCPDCPVMKAMLSGAAQEIEKTTPGGRSWIIRGYPVNDEGGISVGGIEITLDITDQKKVLEELKIAHDIINKSPSVAFLWKNEAGWPVEFVTANVERILGYSAIDFIKNRIVYREIIHPDDLDRVTDEVAGYSSENSRTEFSHAPYRIVTKYGDARWVSDKTSIRRDEQGRIIYYQGIIEDITKIKNAEEALRQERDKLETITGSIGAGLAVISRDYKTLWSNSIIKDMFGAVEGNLCFAAYNQRMNVCSECGVKVVFEEGKEKVIHEQYIRQETGQEIWCEIITTPIRDAEGNTTAALELVVPITERKRTEIALAAEKERLAVTLRSIGDGVITTDNEGRVTLINRVAERLTGWTEEDAIGQKIESVFHIVNEFSHKRRVDPIQRVLDSGKIQGLANHTILISKDGRETIIADSGAPIMDSKSSLVGVVLVFRDITKERNMQQELFKVQKLESLGILAGGIAHDFNNFLTAIIGNLSLAKLDVKPSETVFAQLRAMEKASLRAKDLTQQLLTFSKGGEPIKKVVNLTPLIKESVTFALRGSNVKPEFDFSANLRFAEVDEGQLAQVINNLVINADHAMPEGGLIHIRADNILFEALNEFTLAPGDYVKISIEDQGVGVSNVHLTKVFDPYFTTKQKGSGLGLTVAYSIIEKHKGRITVESELAKGTIFSIYLPALAEAAVDIQAQKFSILSGRGRILVMDDEDFIRDLAAQMLRKMGYEVSSAEDGREAIEIYKKAKEARAPFCLVIMDLTVPGGMGGKETVQKLLQFDPDAKVLVSSGYSNDPVMSNYQDYGFQGVIKKPYRLEEMSEALKSALM